MIIYRLWTAAKDENSVGGPSHDLRFIMRVFIESGLLYLLVTIPHFIVWWTNSAPTSAAILVLGWIVGLNRSRNPVLHVDSNHFPEFASRVQRF